MNEEIKKIVEVDPETGEVKEKEVKIGSWRIRFIKDEKKIKADDMKAAKSHSGLKKLIKGILKILKWLGFGAIAVVVGGVIYFIVKGRGNSEMVYDETDGSDFEETTEETDDGSIYESMYETEETEEVSE